MGASDLSTKRDVWSAFVGCASPKVIAAGLAAVAIARIVLGGWAWSDLLAAVAVAVVLGPIEWVIHRFLLHASDTSRLARSLGTGEAHRHHHRDPADLRWLLLPGPNALVSVLAIVVPVGLFAAATGWAQAVTFMGVGLLALLHYEWTHLLVHSAYRPTTRYYARLARNHRLHHYRNERYWLGVTSNSGDRLLSTYPANKRDVPLSDTARTLV